MIPVALLLAVATIQSPPSALSLARSPVPRPKDRTQRSPSDCGPWVPRSLPPP